VLGDRALVVDDNLQIMLSEALASGRDPACRTINLCSVPLFIGPGLIGDEAVPVVVNAKGRKPNEVGPNEVYIGRATRNGWRKSKWANPFRLARNAGQEQRDEVIAMYRLWVQRQPALMTTVPELRGKDLVCWCAPEKCHGDVLLELANRP
jgi:Domain of unknown function (DUF4326)